ncbi:hypothetical protein SLNSH_16980 [Alsobacter soli]|uniref:Uncharacterized protein n=1 Tax=Alsobacter soli TaxID=2109933 RepID=A0A2T1HQ86_9HYPH|nr:hypothetical protein [Alsobacter soli]PSC03803.1 hypothetical protein SLNSH_16980 [Alsobacter soli]
MWRLVYPLKYFRLQNSEKKRFDLLPTLLLAALLAAPFLILPGASFFKPNGLLDKLLALTSALTAFYVAALVAVATFSHPSLDKVIRSGPIALITRDDDGHKIQQDLTRREFACFIFGYLSFSALLISIGAAAAVALSGTAGAFGEAFLWVRSVVIVAFCLALAHLVVATTLGLYYLMDRLYRHDREITSKKSDLAA